MKVPLSLKLIICFSAAGMLFSGYLTFQEFFGSAPPSGYVIGERLSFFGIPAFVYGFVMYAMAVGIAVAGLIR